MSDDTAGKRGPPRYSRQVRELLTLLDAVEADQSTTADKPPAKRRPTTRRQLEALRRGAEKRLSEIEAYGKSAAMRRFSRMVAKKFEAFLPPCDHCRVCEQRLEGEQAGYSHFCRSCVEHERDEDYRDQKRLEHMRAHFGLGPGQRLSAKRRAQYMLAVIYGQVPSTHEVYYGNKLEEETTAH